MKGIQWEVPKLVKSLETEGRSEMGQPWLIDQCSDGEGGARGGGGGGCLARDTRPLWEWKQ